MPNAPKPASGLASGWVLVRNSECLCGFLVGRTDETQWCTPPLRGRCDAQMPCGNWETRCGVLGGGGGRWGVWRRCGVESGYRSGLLIAAAGQARGADAAGAL
jgi:hypothetical protein